ncbi:MAG TPA: hypothetical protein DFS52_06130, partial [Myxococcales bacterium]|nr:hypothetical protein [Myxococcales bacterium]
LTVAVGIISVVAANWDALGRGVKLGLDLVLLTGLALGVFRARGRWAREILVILYFGLTLASIALVSQVYQLGGDVYAALVLWMVLASPVAAFGCSWLVAALWLVGLNAALGTSLEAISSSLDEPAMFALAIGAYSVQVAALLFAGNAGWLRARRPDFAKTFEIVGWAGLVLLTSIAQQLWYADPDGDLLWSIPVPLLMAGLLAWRAPTFLSEPTRSAVRAVRAAILVSIGASAVALLPHPDIDFLAPLTFIAVWIAFAAACQQVGRIGLLNAATAVIALRVVIAYVELFGSLLETGLAMIGGGLLTIGLAWLWRRLARGFKSDAERTEEVGQ